jgi:hypothetical protein
MYRAFEKRCRRQIHYPSGAIFWLNVSVTPEQIDEDTLFFLTSEERVDLSPRRLEDSLRYLNRS